MKYEQARRLLRARQGPQARALSVNTVKNFAQTLRLMSISKEMVENDDFATKREAYYVSKNWGECKFNEQTESDGGHGRHRGLASLDGLSREQLRYYPEEHGGSVAGNLVVIDRDSETGDSRCVSTAPAFGTGSYSIPHSVEHLKFETDAKFILAIETGGMFQRLNNHKFWKSQVRASSGGRRADARHAALHPHPRGREEDPGLLLRRLRSLRLREHLPHAQGRLGQRGAHQPLLLRPQAQYLGVTPQDIIDFKLEDATHKLLAVDIKRAKDALKNDPFFKAHAPWKKAINQLLKMGVRAEQQALAKWGLNFVIEEYLPHKLKNKKSFLP